MFQGSPNESIRNRIPLAYDPSDARRDPAHPRPPRPLRPDPVRRRAGLSRADLRDRGHGRAGAARPARLGQAPAGVREARPALGEATPRRGGRGRARRAGHARARNGARRRGRGRDRHDRRRGGPGGREVEDDEADAPLTPERVRRVAGRGCGRRRRPGLRRDRGRGRRRPPSSSPTTTCSRADDWPPSDRDGGQRQGVGRAEPRGGPALPAAGRRRRPRRAALRRARGRARTRCSSRPVDYDEEVEVAPGIHATFVDAGHILGSAIIRLRVARSRATAAPERPIVFSGDLGRPDTPIIRDPTVVTDADYVLMESTYGGREHEPQDEAIRILAETVQLVAEHDGVLLVPSFAIGRTQEVVWQLDRLLEEGKIPPLPLYLDSPMASKATRHLPPPPGLLRRGDAPALREERRPLDYPNQIITNDVKAVAGDRAGAAAVHDRRVQRHAHRRPGRRPPARTSSTIPTPSLLFVGYQGEGTLGAHLQAGAKHGQARRPDPRRSAARSARSAASRPTPTSPSCWTGSRTSGAASSRATPASRGGSSSSTATRTASARWSRRSGRSGSRRISPSGTRR